MNRFVRVLFLVLLITSPTLLAQNLGTGLYAFGSFDSRGFDTTNIGNLNTHFEIPIVSKKGRGLDFNYAFAYDSLVWSPVVVSGSTYWTPDQSFGFRGELGGALTGYITYNQSTITCLISPGHTISGTKWTNYVYHDPYGKNHTFAIMKSTCELAPGTGLIIGTGSTSDGSGLSFDTTVITTRSGQVIKAPMAIGRSQAANATIVDTNGNTITNNGNGTFTDTLGKTALTIGGGGNASSPLTFTYPVTLQANQATSAGATVYYKTYTVQTHFQCSGITEFGATNVDLVDHIILADGTTYNFGYEATPTVSGSVTGRLALVTLPNGGTISYSYSGGCNGNGINADGTVGNLTRTTTDGSRSYTRTTVNAKATTTTVQDEKGNQTLYQFTGSAGVMYETHRQVYQGAIGGTLLLDQSTCYNGAQPSATEQR